MGDEKTPKRSTLQTAEWGGANRSEHKMNGIAISRQDRETGQKNFSRYLFFGELGGVFLSEVIVILLAMQMEANNLQLGYLAASGYFTGIAMLLTPSFFGGLRLVSAAWLLAALQALCALPYLLAGWFYYGYPTMSSWILLGGVTAYTIMRNFNRPLQREVPCLLLRNDQSETVPARWTHQTNPVRICAYLVIALLLGLKIWSESKTLLLVVLAGILISLTATMFLRRIPLEERVSPSSSGAARALLEEIWRKENLPPALLYCGTVALLVMSPFLLPLFRYQAGMPTGMLALFAALAAAAVPAAEKILPRVSARTGRHLPTYCGSLIIAAGIALALLPEWTNWAIWLALGVIMIMALTALTMQTARLVLQRIASDNRSGALSILNFAAAWIALITGLTAGRCADSQLFHILRLPNNYSCILLAMAIIAAVMTIYCFFFLREPPQPTAPAIHKLLLSTENLKVFLLEEQLGEAPRDYHREKLIMFPRSDTTADLAAKEIRRRLQTTQAEVKDDLLRALFFHPRQEILEELLAEAADRDSWCRDSALFALGAYHDSRGEQVLLQVYHNENDDYLRAIAAQSLARIGYSGDLTSDLNSILQDTQHHNVKTTATLLVAMILSDRNGTFLSDLIGISRLRDSESFRQPAYNLIAQRLGGEPGLDHFFYLERQQSGLGSEELLEENGDLPEFMDAGDALRGWLSEPDYPSIMVWCRKQTTLIALHDHLAQLGNGIARGTEYKPSKTDAIAMLYFTALMLRRHHAGQTRFNWQR